MSPKDEARPTVKAGMLVPGSMGRPQISGDGMKSAELSPPAAASMSARDAAIVGKSAGAVELALAADLATQSASVAMASAAGRQGTFFGAAAVQPSRVSKSTRESGMAYGRNSETPRCDNFDWGTTTILSQFPIIGMHMHMQRKFRQPFCFYFIQFCNAGIYDIHESCRFSGVKKEIRYRARYEDTQRKELRVCLLRTCRMHGWACCPVQSLRHPSQIIQPWKSRAASV